MIFTPLSLAGAVLIDIERHEDERGFFARTLCAEEFAARGLQAAFVQDSLSHNRIRGTLRGLHLQRPPHAETKLVRCSRGAIYDVIVDLRPGSPTWGRWEGVVLSAENGRALYVPEGFAHGFLTLADETEVSYRISHPHKPEAATGLRYDDPRLGIVWPEPVAAISARDRSWPLLAAAESRRAALCDILES